MGRGPGPGRCHAPGVRGTGSRACVGSTAGRWRCRARRRACRSRIRSGARIGWRVDRRCRGLGGPGWRREHRLGQDGRVRGRTDRRTDGRIDDRIHPRRSPAPAHRPAARAGRHRVRRGPRDDQRASPGRAEGPQAEGGHPRVHVLRRRRRPLRARLARRQLVRDDERHVLDAQPEGIRRPAQARTRVPGPRPARDRGPGSRARRTRTPCRARPTPRPALRTSSRRSRRPAPAEPGAPPTHTTSSWWESTAGATGPSRSPAREQPRAAAAPRTSGRDRTTPPDIGRAMADIGRALTDEGFGGSAAGSAGPSSAGCRSRSGSAGSPAR